MDIDMDCVREITKFRDGKIKRLMKYFYELDPQWQAQAVKYQIDKSNRLRKKRPPGKTGEFYYSCLLIALNDLKRVESEGEGIKPKYMKGMNAKSIIKLRVSTIRKGKSETAAERRDAILELLPVISRLREGKVAWRKIAAYIETEHGKAISHEYLRKIYNEYK